MKIHKLNKLQAPYLSNLGDTTSPLSRKPTKSASENAFTFLKIPIAPLMSALRVFPMEQSETISHDRDKDSHDKPAHHGSLRKTLC